MQQLSRALVFLAVVSLILASVPAGAQAVKGVEVTNTAGNPVPTVAQGTTVVGGTVNVGNTPNVNVSNTPNVNINNTPNVNVVSMPPLEIGNAEGSSIPVHNSVEHQTVSFGIALAAGSQSGSSHPQVPGCSGTQEFLVDSVFAAPDPFDGDVKTLTAWAVRVATVHESPGGSKDTDPIVVYGNGPQHASGQLGAGQATFAPSAGGGLEAIVSTLGVPAAGNFVFRIHVSGYCGTPFVSP